MTAVLSDPALYAFIGGAPPGEEELRARYARQTAGSPDPGTTWCNWVLQLRATGELVGTVQATLAAATAEVAWVVGTPWQGRGLATEAARALVAALREHGVRVVRAHIHPDHRSSAAVAAAVGLRRTGILRDGELRWECPLT